MFINTENAYHKYNQKHYSLTLTIFVKKIRIEKMIYQTNQTKKPF
jgi:hypothetical protein